jgi:hypothetical protein
MPCLHSFRAVRHTPRQRPTPRRAARRPGVAQLAALVLVLAPAVLRAQDSAQASTDATDRANDARNSFTIGGAVTLANGSIKGVTFDRHLFLAGVGYSRALVHNRVLALSYTPQLVPAAMLSQPVLGNHHFAVQYSLPPFTHTETTYGAGASPIGLELRFRPNRDLQPLVGTDEGFLYFSRNVPTLFAAQFNFTVDVRFGLRFRLDHGRALSLEYVYHHLSNGYRALQNPGVDSQMLCVGYVRVLSRS